jgi:hypothetical protein
MGMVWLRDVMARKPKPTNTSPGLIYMLNGATQHSYTFAAHRGTGTHTTTVTAVWTMTYSRP